MMLEPITLIRQVPVCLSRLLVIYVPRSPLFYQFVEITVVMSQVDVSIPFRATPPQTAVQLVHQTFLAVLARNLNLFAFVK
ncbi:MAG: hypothetical protein H8D34_13210 [Chloroflexi bacterium]|nr:hypothetical protein [Chloroflexota bacterium]